MVADISVGSNATTLTLTGWATNIGDNLYGSGVAFVVTCADPFGGGTTIISVTRPPDADDRTFVLDLDAALDRGCQCSDSGPIEFGIPVTRYAGPTNPDGTLENAGVLVQNGHISPQATLLLMVWDVDSGASIPGALPEMSRVFFNDELVPSLDPGNTQFLVGRNEQWRMNTFRIPIDRVRFPAAIGTGGNPPTPAVNTVRIEPGAGNPTQAWCLAVDWAALLADFMSPVVLIHGINERGAVFTGVNEGGLGGDRTFLDNPLTQRLDEIGLLWDNRINMDVLEPDPANPGQMIRQNRMRNNARDIDQELPVIASEFGVDSVHFVAHSKGGLDAKAYLAEHQPTHDDQFTVVSLTTLSTPHNGSVLADIVVERSRQVERRAIVEFQGFPAFTGLLTAFFHAGVGEQDLQVAEASAFGALNVAQLVASGSARAYNVVGADADLNDNGDIDAIPDEFEAFRRYIPAVDAIWSIPVIGPLIAAGGVNIPYQILRGAAQITVAEEDINLGALQIRRAVFRRVRSPAPLPNDIAVTIESALGVADPEGTIAFPGGHTFILDGANGGRDHFGVLDSGVADEVIPWLREAERTFGDFSPRQGNAP